MLHLTGCWPGEESFKCEKLCQPNRTGPHQEQRDCFTWIIVPRSDQCPETGGTEMLVRLSNVPNVAHTAYRVQTNPFGNLGSLGDWTLDSTNVEGGLHLVLTRSPKKKIINCCVHPHRNLFWLEALHQFMDKDAVGPIQNLFFFLQPYLVPKPHNHWKPIVGLSNQTFRRPSGPPSNNGSGLPQ